MNTFFLHRARFLDTSRIDDKSVQCEKQLCCVPAKHHHTQDEYSVLVPKSRCSNSKTPQAYDSSHTAPHIPQPRSARSQSAWRAEPTATNLQPQSQRAPSQGPTAPTLHSPLQTINSTIAIMLGLRTAARASTALPAFRNQAARRWTSGIGAKGLEGPADNAFNRERAAVKQHAADTSGESSE